MARLDVFSGLTRTLRRILSFSIFRAKAATFHHLAEALHGG